MQMSLFGKEENKVDLKWTQEQLDLVGVKDGAVAVVAVPGSGKTSTLAMRCDALCGDGTILVLAFNRKAKEAFKSKLTVSKKVARVQTINGYCMDEIFRSYRKVGMQSKPKVDTKYMNGINFTALRECGAVTDRGFDDERLDDDMLKYYDAWFYDYELLIELAVQGEKIATQNFSSLAEEKETKAKFRAVEAVQKYRKWIIEECIYTHSSAVRLLAQNPEAIQRRFQHVMIDEFQDIDKFQWKVLSTVGKDAKSFVVVGDPNQRIYEWRGALMDAFGTFFEAFPEARPMRLSTNFRSFSEITDLAESICSAGIVSNKGSDPESVKKVGSLSEVVAAMQIAPKSFSVLCRYRAECLLTKLTLFKHRVPAKVHFEGKMTDIPHIAAAISAIRSGRTLEDLLASSVWTDCLKKSRYRAKSEKEAALKDAEILYSITLQDLEFVLKLENPESHAVFISTIHSVKGEEYENVVFKLPLSPEEDPFVNYVAVTRAQKRLFLLPDDGEFRKMEQNSGPEFGFLTE